MSCNSKNGPGKAYRNSISFVELFKRFPDNESAEDFFIKVRWPDEVTCPRCGSTNVKERAKGKIKSRRWICQESDCKFTFSAKTDSILHNSNIGFQNWIIGIYLFVFSGEGYSSLRLHNSLDLSQDASWHMGHRIRKAMEFEFGKFQGPVQIDETYIGGKEKWKHQDKKLKAGRGATGKIPVIGIIDVPTNRMKTFTPGKDNVNKKVVEKIILENVAPGAKIFTDESPIYNGLKKLGYDHRTVNHSRREWARYEGDDVVTTNSVESEWAMTKRSVRDTYRKMTEKHMGRYAKEIEGRKNIRDLDTEERMKKIIRSTVGKRLSWEDLTGHKKAA